MTLQIRQLLYKYCDMDRSERVGRVVFVAAPLVAATVGYRYMGWLGAFVYALAALPVLAISVMTSFLVVLGFGFVRDRKKVGLLSTDSLREVIANPKDPDFRFAFTELILGGRTCNPLIGYC